MNILFLVKPNPATRVKSTCTDNSLTVEWVIDSVFTEEELFPPGIVQKLQVTNNWGEEKTEVGRKCYIFCLDSE